VFRSYDAPMNHKLCLRCGCDWTSKFECNDDWTSKFDMHMCEKCDALENNNGFYLFLPDGRVLCWYAPNHPQNEVHCEIYLNGQYAITKQVLPLLPYDIPLKQLEKYLVLL
jgi:hypothetical protein